MFVYSFGNDIQSYVPYGDRLRRLEGYLSDKDNPMLSPNYNLLNLGSDIWSGEGGVTLPFDIAAAEHGCTAL